MPTASACHTAAARAQKSATRRKLQTPGNAEEHKRQEIPTQKSDITELVRDSEWSFELGPSASGMTCFRCPSCAYKFMCASRRALEADGVEGTQAVQLQKTISWMIESCGIDTHESSGTRHSSDHRAFPTPFPDPLERNLDHPLLRHLWLADFLPTHSVCECSARTYACIRIPRSSWMCPFTRES